MAADEGRRIEASVETELDAAHRLYAAAVVRWDVLEMGRWADEIESLEIERMVHAIYSEELGFEPAEEVAA